MGRLPCSIVAPFALRRAPAVLWVALWITCPALLVLGASGCGGDDKPITIPPFSQPVVEMVVGTSFTLVVNLNRTAPEPLVVTGEVEPTFSSAVALSPATLSYARGEQSQSVRVSASGSTANRQARVTFTIDGTDTKQVWRVTVSEPVL